MPDIHIERAHGLGLAEARRLAHDWASQATERYDMQCTYAEGLEGGTDCLTFSRSGVSGTLRVDGASFVFDAKLGFLLGAFKDTVEAKINQNLDELLGPKAAT